MQIDKHRRCPGVKAGSVDLVNFCSGGTDFSVHPDRATRPGFFR